MVDAADVSVWNKSQAAGSIAESSAKTRSKRSLTDKTIVFVLSCCAAAVLLPLVSILVHLVSQGLSSINLDFFIHLPKPVGETGGGMANAIVGSLVLLGIAILTAVPIGIGAGIYVSEYAHHRFAYAIRFTTDVMTGIPSIVYGIFAYTLFVIPMRSFSALSGGAALGIMMVPIITRTTEDFLALVPSSLREAGLALGAPQWRVITDIVLPTARGGIITGVMVALARVAGETAPLLFTAFGNHFWHSHLTEPIAALPLQIFSYAISPFDDWHRQAWAGALVLIGLILVVNLSVGYYKMLQSRLLSKHQ